MSDQNPVTGAIKVHGMTHQTVRELILNEEFAKAATLLEQRLNESASDDERRLMAACLFELANYEGALAHLAQLRQQRLDDAFSKGWLQHQEEYLDRAKAVEATQHTQISETVV